MSPEDALDGLLEEIPAGHPGAEDVRAVFARLTTLYAPRQAAIWMRSYNYGLNSRPLDVLLLSGREEVDAAVAVEERHVYG